jgi:Spy/CpxP family protein refolding chaperone
MERRAALYFVLTFVLGVAAGAVGMFLYAWYGGHWHRPMTRPDFVKYLSQELKLDTQQTQQVTQIIEASSKKFDDLRAQTRPQFDALRQQTDAQIRQVLRPDQERKFDDVIRRWRQSMPGGRGRGGHPPPPSPGH